MTDYKLLTLENGLRIVMVPRQSTEVLTAMVMFGVGSRYESDEIAGLSHVLEHMCYKGTKKRPTSLKISEFIESIGGEHNAFTGKEYTGYYAKVAPKHLEKALDFLSDLLLNSKYDAADLEREKGVIIQEINMYEDLPMEMVGNNFETAVFGKNPLGRDIIGYKTSVSKIDQKTLVSYWNDHYSADNAVLVLAGNLKDYDEKSIEDLAKKYFQFKNAEKALFEKIQINGQKATSIVKKKTEQSHIVVGFKTVSFNHPDYFKLELLATILGGSMSSRMFEEIREKRSLAYAVRSQTTNYQESGSLLTQAGVPHEKALEAIEAIIGEYEKIKTEKVPEEELAKAKEVINGKMLIRFEDSEELASHFAFETLLAKNILTPQDIAKIYNEISADDIMNMANKYFTDERMGLSFIGEDIDEGKLKEIYKIN